MPLLALPTRPPPERRDRGEIWPTVLLPSPITPTRFSHSKGCGCVAALMMSRHGGQRQRTYDHGEARCSRHLSGPYISYIIKRLAYDEFLGQAVAGLAGVLQHQSLN